MPVPVSWDDLNTNPAQNSPQGSEPLGTQADDYLRQAFAFLKQLHDGWLAADGTVKFTGDLDADTHTIKNLAAPVDLGDATSKEYVDGVLSTNFPRGTIVLWFGDLANKSPLWLVCDGTNGTPDMRNKFPIGAGDQTANGVLGGNSFPVISPAQMPAHSHVVSDPGHAHNVYDPSHAHGVSDGGHSHGQINISGNNIGGSYLGNGTNNFSGGGSGMFGWGGTPFGTSGANANIGIYANGTGIAIYGSGTGIQLQNAGSSQAFDNRPAFVGLHYLMKS